VRKNIRLTTVDWIGSSNLPFLFFYRPFRLDADGKRQADARLFFLIKTNRKKQHCTPFELRLGFVKALLTDLVDDRRKCYKHLILSTVYPSLSLSLSFCPLVFMCIRLNIYTTPCLSSSLLFHFRRLVAGTGEVTEKKRKRERGGCGGWIKK